MSRGPSHLRILRRRCIQPYVTVRVVLGTKVARRSSLGSAFFQPCAKLALKDVLSRTSVCLLRSTGDSPCEYERARGYDSGRDREGEGDPHALGGDVVDLAGAAAGARAVRESDG